MSCVPGWSTRRNTLQGEKVHHVYANIKTQEGAPERLPGLLPTGGVEALTKPLPGAAVTEAERIGARGGSDGPCNAVRASD